MKKYHYISIVLISLLTFSAEALLAQAAAEKFGKNRLQYKNFKWRYYSTPNYDVYFYDGGNEIARIAIDYLEKEYDRITDLLGTVSYNKTEIFLYNSPTDLLQSNIGVNDNSFEVAGQTNFVKSQVEIAYPGTAEEFKKVLVYKASRMLIYDMLYGGRFSDMFKNSVLMSLPDWFLSGIARYAAYGWDTEMDDYIRDIMRNKNIRNLAKFKEYDAEIIGQSIWNFIAERYGVSYISNILNLTRIIRDEKRSISGTIGVPFKSVVAEWKNYYLQQASFVDQNYVLPAKNQKIFSNSKRVIINDLKLSPEGNFYAYSINNDGKYKVILNQRGRKRSKTLVKGGYKLINQDAKDRKPLLSWRDEGTLGIIHTKAGKNFLTVYDVGSGKKIRKELTRINQITDFDILRNGNLAVLSADHNGDTDLYLISLRRNSIKRLTRDFYDDINPRFVPGTSSIIFSSNRLTDTISIKGRDIEKIKNNYNLYVYNIDTSKSRVTRITNMLSKDIKPIAVNDHEIYYLSDQQGIFNLYKYDLKAKMYHQVTNFGSGIKDFDLTWDKRFFGFVMNEKSRDNIFLYDGYDLNTNIFTAQTLRQQYLTAKYVAKKIKSANLSKTLQQKKAKTGKGVDVEKSIGAKKVARQNIEEVDQPTFLDDYQSRLATIPGAGESLVDTKNYAFSIKPSRETLTRNEEPKKTDKGGDIIDTEGYVFDTDVVKSSKNTGSFLSNYQMLRRDNDVAGPFPFDSKFSADNIVTSFVIDPLIGFGITLETQMNDQLENHKFYGGILITGDLKSGYFYGEYRYLKHTIDFAARYERETLYRTTENMFYQKYTLNTYSLAASLPFSASSRLSIIPFFETTRFWDLDPTSVLFPTSGPVTSRVNFGGIKVEYIFDNTVVEGLNILYGTRGKIGLRHNEGLSDRSKSFSNFYVDFRHYQRLHKEIVFATRLFYGRYWGPNPQKYLLGGMDNWLFNSTNSTGAGDPLKNEVGVDNSNILYVDYVTSLRGFKYNTFNGENALLFNAELRMPIIKYLASGPVASNFLRNFQLIGFYDIGSAWTGPSPWATENSVNTEIIAPEGSPFKARIQNFKNPWLSSYGIGVRSMLLGYYVKFDIAFPIEDMVQKDAKFLLTLGYDF